MTGFSAADTGERLWEIIDKGVIESLRDLNAGGDVDIICEMIEIYLADTPPRIDILCNALNNNDTAALQFTAHSLKSSSASVGAMALSSLAKDLEEAGRSGNIAGAGELIRKIEEEYERVRAALGLIKNNK